MTIDEVFASMAKHMIEGMMFHEQCSQYYLFLNLNGYAKCHEYHFLSESCGYLELCRHYICKHNKLIPNTNPNTSSVIPADWYQYSRMDVDIQTKRKSAKSILESWVSWEQKTKQTYQEIYCELLDSGCIADTRFVGKYISDVSDELEIAERCLLNKKTTDYDMVSMVEEQKEIEIKYKKQIHEFMGLGS